MVADELQYVGFWKRFAAFWLDLIILLPLAMIASYLTPKYRLFYAYDFALNIFITFFYSIYLVKRYGGTPGKLIVGIQIAKVDGSPVAYREAFLRYAPDLAFWIISSIGAIYFTLQMTDSEYVSLSPHERHTRIFEQSWLKWVQIMSGIWVWSEFVVLLTNKKKRALHDFLAGTVVIEKLSVKN